MCPCGPPANTGCNTSECLLTETRVNHVIVKSDVHNRRPHLLARSPSDLHSNAISKQHAAAPASVAISMRNTYDHTQHTIVAVGSIIGQQTQPSLVTCFLQCQQHKQWQL
jgi:hypothetical protein